MGAENNLGEVLNQLAIKDAGPIAELTPEQSKLVNTERCFPALDVIVKFAQGNHGRDLKVHPNDHVANYHSSNVLNHALSARAGVEKTGVALVHSIAVGKMTLRDQSPNALTRQADGGAGAQQLMEDTPTTDLSRFSDLTGIVGPSNEAARFISYPEIHLTDPSNHELLVAVNRAIKNGKKGVSIPAQANNGWTIISQAENLPNTLCFKNVIEKYFPVDGRNGSRVMVVTEQNITFTLACFSDAEWERAQLAVDKPDYAARYAYLKSKLSTNDQGEPSLRNIEQNIAVNGDLALRGEISLRDAKLPALVSAPEGKFIAWRNPARAGQVEFIPTTSKDLVERVILSGGDPSAAIKRLQELDISDNTTREAIRPTSPQDAEAQYRLKVQIDTLRQVVVGRNFNIRVPTPSGMQPREAMIKGVSLGTDNRIHVDMQYKSSAGGWKSIQPLVAESPDLVVVTIKTTFPQFGNTEIVFV